MKGCQQKIELCKASGFRPLFVTHYVLSSNEEGDILHGDTQKEGDPGSPMKQSLDAMIVAGAGGVFHFGEAEVLGEPVLPKASPAQCWKAHPVDGIITTCTCYGCCSQFSCLGGNFLEVMS